MNEQSSGQFIDIHCHCLSGLDDGPPDADGSLRLCRALSADGIGVVVATPHQLGRWDGANWAGRIREEVAALNKALARDNIALKVLAGADVRVDERILQLLESDKVLTLGDAGKCMLLELPHEIFIDIEFLLVELSALGVQSVISHPERNGVLSKRPDAIAGWRRHAPCLQLTAASLVGLFGETAQQAAWRFLDMPFPLVVATDSHDTESRAPCMSRAYEMLRQNRGERIARALCIDNPARIIQGQHALTLNELITGDRRQ
jgi:protein-tyrosine phosphatase